MSVVVCHTDGVVAGGVDGAVADAGASVGRGERWADGPGLGLVDAAGDGEAVGSTDGVEGDDVGTGEGVAPATQPPRSASDAKPATSRAATVCQRMALYLRDARCGSLLPAPHGETRRGVRCCALDRLGWAQSLSMGLTAGFMSAACYECWRPSAPSMSPVRA